MKKVHRIYSRAAKAAQRSDKAAQEFAELALEILREGAKPQKGQKYLELEAVMPFPVDVCKKEIIGKIITNDDHSATQGIISSAKKEGRPKDGQQRWRVVSQITDEKLVTAFGAILPHKIKVMK